MLAPELRWQTGRASSGRAGGAQGCGASGSCWLRHAEPWHCSGTGCVPPKRGSEARGLCWNCAGLCAPGVRLMGPQGDRGTASPGLEQDGGRKGRSLASGGNCRVKHVCSVLQSWHPRCPAWTLLWPVPRKPEVGRARSSGAQSLPLLPQGRGRAVESSPLPGPWWCGEGASRSLLGYDICFSSCSEAELGLLGAVCRLHGLSQLQAPPCSSVLLACCEQGWGEGAEEILGCPGVSVQHVVGHPVPSSTRTHPLVWGLQCWPDPRLALGLLVLLAALQLP